MNTAATKNIFASRVERVPQSFIREILKVTANPDIVSFAGGLPNPALFPLLELEQCAAGVFKQAGLKVLQYAETEGFYPLREYISQRYKQKHGLDISPEKILITNGSQQGLDLIGKLFINSGDKILVERPAYLGALQCFCMFEADFCEVNLDEDGIDTKQFEDILSKEDIKLFYGVPNFQNPTGISYSEEKRKKTAEILSRSDVVFVEDDPYGDIAFGNNIATPIYSYIPNQTILLGSFSKIIAPGLRLGWMVAEPEIIRKATILKQATDLHSGNLSQYILHEFVSRFDLNAHINIIRTKYSRQRDIMLEALHQYFPATVRYTRPDGGMFCWITLPQEISSRELLRRALDQKIIFVPGDPFYAKKPDSQTLRLNFSNVEEGRMVEALKTLGSLF